MNIRSYRVMTIIFSVLTFGIIALFNVGLFVLPLTGPNGLSFYGYIDQLLKLINNLFGGGSGSSVADYISVLINIGFICVATTVFGIIGFVYSIILLVDAIKCLSKLKIRKVPLKHYVSFGANAIIYSALMLAVSSTANTEIVTFIGTGVIMALASGVVALVIAGYYHFVDHDRRLTCKILDVSTSIVAAGFLISVCTLSLSFGEYNVGIINGFSDIVQNVVSAGTAPDTNTMMWLLLSLFSFIMIFVSMGLAKSILVNGFTPKIKVKPDRDYPKSSIIKSSFWVVFSISAVVILSICTIGFNGNITMIIAAALPGVSLILSILNRIFQGQPGAYLAKRNEQKAVASEPKYNDEVNYDSIDKEKEKQIETKEDEDVPTIEAEAENKEENNDASNVIEEVQIEPKEEDVNPQEPLEEEQHLD